MIEKLLTEQANPASQEIDRLSTEQILRVMNAEDQKVATAVAAEVPAIARAVEAIADALQSGGRLYYIGAGTSGRLGVLDAAECPPTFGVPADLVVGILAGGAKALVEAGEASEDDAGQGALDLEAAGFTARDVLVGIAASGRTPYVLGAVEAARRLGAVTVGISCTPDSELSREVDIPIAPLSGPEVVTGSTRLKAGTATKLVLNMLSTGAMIRLGYVFGNLMVNVQPKNEKLVDRARRIIAAATGVNYDRAAELLEASGMQVPLSIVMGSLGVDRAEAERRLAASKGRIRVALDLG
jgi:N-acetylmuramic acid 6-phosphate etherase